MKIIQKLGAIAQLVRPLNCAMASFATALGYWISAGGIYLPFQVFLAAAATFSVCVAGQAINDYYDADTDRKTRKTRPIPSGRLSALEAKAVAVSLFILGIVLTAFVNESAFGLAIAFSLLLYSYSAHLRKRKYFGNALVSLATAFTYIMGAAITGNYPLVAIVASASFFASWGREIAKDLEDYESDKGRKTTLPMVWGVEGAKKAAASATGFAIFFGVLPILTGLAFGYAFDALIAVAIGLFLVAILQVKRGEYAKAQGTYKTAMICALAAFASTLIAGI